LEKEKLLLRDKIDDLENELKKTEKSNRKNEPDEVEELKQNLEDSEKQNESLNLQLEDLRAEIKQLRKNKKVQDSRMQEMKDAMVYNRHSVGSISADTPLMAIDESNNTGPGCKCSIQ